MEERVGADGGLHEPCRSRVLESALVLALMRRLTDFSGSRQRVTGYLGRQCAVSDPLDRSLARVSSGMGPAPQGEDFRELVLAQVPSYVAPRRRLVLDALAVVLGSQVQRGGSIPGAARRAGLHSWARVQTVAAEVIVTAAQGRTGEISGDDIAVLTAAAREARGGVWEQHVLAHLLMLHALVRVPGHDGLVREGLRGLLPLQRPDGGFPFVSDIDTWATATGGLALAAAGAPLPVLRRVAAHLEGVQKPCGGWSITSCTELADTDDTSVALEFLQLLDPGRSTGAVEAGLEHLRRLRGTDGGFPTYVAGGPSEACMTAAVINAFIHQGTRNARLLDDARRFLAAGQDEDGYFEPGWSNSRLHVLYRARAAAGVAPAGLRMAARIEQVVRATQNTDGGWGREPGWPSDPISTSYAVLALDCYRDARAAQNAVAYLLERQREDGGFDSPPDMVGPRPFTYHVPLLTDICVLRALGHLTHPAGTATPPVGIGDPRDRRAQQPAPTGHRSPGQARSAPRGPEHPAHLYTRPRVRPNTVTEPFPQTVSLPALAHALPRALHPDSEQLLAETAAWAHEHLGFAYDGDHDKIAHNTDGALLVAFSLPHVSYDLTLTCCKLMNYLIGIENSLVDQGALGGSSFATRGVFSRTMADLLGWQDGATPLTAEFRHLRRTMPRPAWERLVAYVEDFAYGFTRELEQWRGSPYTGYQDYLGQRRSSLGVRWLFGFAEAAHPRLGISGDIFEEPAVAALHDTAVDGYTLINDLVSYRREAAMGDDMNLVHHLKTHDGLGTEAAMNRLCSLIDENEAAFVLLRDQILSQHAEAEPQLRSYLEEVGHIMTSNLWWATVSDRYEPGGLDWDGTVPGTLTLHHDHADFSPAPHPSLSL
ncbi:prenyltransferase/squalene oxidase repeat-containing protein [Streptomyces sp. NPDC006632]|uniref:terpene synthase family protein n=1 Tax=Streptomyces sp. NPDC006632 TaxID=3157182 RepID=UPI0033BA8E15